MMAPDSIASLPESCAMAGADSTTPIPVAARIANLPVKPFMHFLPMFTDAGQAVARKIQSAHGGENSERAVPCQTAASLCQTPASGCHPPKGAFEAPLMQRGFFA
ncbi:hypothetical protein GCM10011349_21200 [Novosphingobium indicum]|uniref:Uncharacterized protein n=1 Tax=Novosphingobium indicum TaxID=462949 RepID=A0ABQ2JM59_9SPHN|nr:hypothetical protein GCM10011349_21200 [Novosphingobium indicum]